MELGGHNTPGARQTAWVSEKTPAMGSSSVKLMHAEQVRTNNPDFKPIWRVFKGLVRAVLRGAALSCAVLFYSVLCHIVLCCAVLPGAVLLYPVPSVSYLLICVGNVSVYLSPICRYISGFLCHTSICFICLCGKRDGPTPWVPLGWSDLTNL